MIAEPSRPVAAGAPSVPRQGDAALRRAAEALEATFLSEMLKSAGFGEARDGFGGGAGEAQFASLLRDEQARAIVAAGGLGIAERIFRALAKGGPDAGA
ncbi:MAG: rod-binding protein [Paracoccaceae bacterium]